MQAFNTFKNINELISIIEVTENFQVSVHHIIS